MLRAGVLCLLIALVSATGSLWVVPSAMGEIRIGSGIDSVSLGNTRAQVSHRLGRPSAIAPPDWVYRSHLVGKVGFDATRHVSSISTRSTRQATNRGIAPGASFGRVRAVYPQAHCYGHASAGQRALCMLRSRLHGKAVETDFVFGPRLIEVDIYLVM